MRVFARSFRRPRKEIKGKEAENKKGKEGRREKMGKNVE